MNAAFAAQAGYPFLNTEQAQTFHLSNVKSLPVILNDQQQAI